MSTHRRGHGRGRGRIGNAMPEASGNNPNPVDFMASLGNMAAAMHTTAEALGNQINNGNNGNNGDDGPMTLSSFLKVRPPTFRGTSNPTDTDNWIQAIERALQAQQVPDEQRVGFGTYQLQEEAQHWWQGMRCILQPDGLKQGQMTVIEYTSRFEELYRFSRICQGAPEDFAEWKCIKYKGGLRSDILSFVAPMEIRVFSELVNKSRIAKECVRNAAVEKSDNQEFHQRDHHQNLVPRGRGFKQREYAQPFPHGRNLVGLDDDHQGDGRRKQTRDTSEELTCQKCGRYHPNRPCRIGLGDTLEELTCQKCGRYDLDRSCHFGFGVCYKCGLPGYVSRNCLQEKTQDGGRSN
ncbi:uncharacterized protein LOC107632943 [Arachis ipaensis]|uniref:uncharacterized protein LOC107632943 n=1 Tax=Arachis ipaensis TaxID=130454 RepID=UPI0007AF672A|nr:uncharacterized protein LOC107632943 [Arachis ipaensis]